MWMSFTIFPAIDLRSGLVVRLVQGDPEKVTVYGNDPVATALHWVGLGAAWLHVVNLDGAFGEANQENLDALKAILKISPKTKVQFGGGLRSIADIERILDFGVSRVILGTTALESPDVLRSAIEKFGSKKVCVGIDAKGNRIRVHGWTKESDLNPLTFGKKMVSLGVEIAIFTNISRDGVGSGVDIKLTKELAQKTGLSVIASGGVDSINDVKKVKESGLAGLIIGRALYDEKIDLQEALRWQ